MASSYIPHRPNFIFIRYFSNRSFVVAVVVDREAPVTGFSHVFLGDAEQGE